MRVFELENGKRPLTVVAGLTWHPLVPDNFKRELHPLSQDLGTDLYVYRRSDKSMVGFAKSEDGAKAGQIPIALVISQCLEQESQPSNALIAVEIPDVDQSAASSYVYVLIRDGFVLADGDQVGNEVEIRERFFADLSVSGWDLLVAPDHWKVHLASSRDLNSFLPTKGSKAKIPASWRLKPVNVSFKKALVTALAIVGLATIGYTAFNLWKKEEAAKQQAQIAAQQAAAAESALQEKMAREPWKDIPRASAFMNTCDAAMRRIGVTAGDWSMGQFACENGTFTIVWQRATASALVSHIKSLYPSAVVSADGAFATVITKITNSPIGKTVEVLPNYQMRIDAFRDSKSHYGIAVNFDTKAAPVQAPNADGQPKQSLAMPWSWFEITADSKLSPQSTVEALDAPGFRITKVEGTLKSGLINYQVKGIQYAKP